MWPEGSGLADALILGSLCIVQQDGGQGKVKEHPQSIHHLFTHLCAVIVQTRSAGVIVMGYTKQSLKCVNFMSSVASLCDAEYSVLQV